MHSRSWPKVRKLLIGVSSVALYTASMASVQAQDVPNTSVISSFAISAQPLGDALTQFSLQSGVDIYFEEADVEGVTVAALNGDLTVEGALSRLLAGTGIPFSAGVGGGLIIGEPYSFTQPTAVSPQAKNTASRVAQVETPPVVSEPVSQDVALDSVNEDHIDTNDQDTIVVTGTRLGSEFEGIAPVQVISQEKVDLAGLFDTAEVLRTQPQVSGPKSTLQYNQDTFGALNSTGIGTQTIALRGFTPAQTLLLIDGRRIAAAGTDSVPQSADTSVIPFNIVESFEILTDGASPVYGTDAIAGVVNIKLRRNFDDTTILGSYDVPVEGGGEQFTISGSSGKTFDRGFAAVAVEYTKSKGLKFKDAKDFGLDCTANYDRASNGEIRENDLFEGEIPGTSLSPCDTSSFNRLRGLVFGDDFSNPYYATPGISNIGTLGLSSFETQPSTFNEAFVLGEFGEIIGVQSNLGLRTLQSAFDINFDEVVDEADQRAFFDPDGDGLVGFDVKDPSYSIWRGEKAENADFIAPFQRISLFTYGDYDLQSFGNASAFFEASYNRRESDVQLVNRSISIFNDADFTVPITNPYNPCGLEQGQCLTGGLSFFDEFGEELFDVTPYGLAYQSLSPFIQFQGDGDRVKSSVDQYRLVTGVRGDFTIGEKLGLKGWNYETALTYSRSEGESSRQGILKDRLRQSAQTTVRDFDSGEIVCGDDLDFDGLPDTPGECVPIDFFAPETLLGGQLSAEARNYLFGEFAYDTQVELFTLSGFISGDAVTLPAGEMSWVLGAEARQDKIDASGNDNVLADSFSSLQALDPSAKGSRWIFDVFGEVGIPLIKDAPFAKSIDLTLAGRVTNEEYTGSNSVYSSGLRYDLTDWLAFRGTVGRSFRSPNSYELFRRPFLIEDESVAFSDPCAVPFDAINVDGEYDPVSDPRSVSVLENCRADGVDPTGLGLDGIGYITNLGFGGATDDLEPETSKALTAGFVLDLNDNILPQSGLTKNLGLSISATYYDTEVKDQIFPGSPFDILGGCYTENDSRRYCGRITRNELGEITDLALGSINGVTRSTDGVDFNFLMTKSFNIGERPFDFAWDLAANYELSVEEVTEFDVRDFSGSYLFPKLKAFSTAQLESGNWIGTWFTSYIDGGGPLEAFPVPGTRTCTTVENLNCQPIENVDDYFTHNLNVTYRTEGWAVSLGLNNIFDAEPPRVAPTGIVTGRVNTVLNGNYDVRGRTLTMTARKSF